LPIHFLFALTTYYSPLTCPLGGTQTKFLVSPSLLKSSAKPSEVVLRRIVMYR
jgi:hypothetical protein